MLILRASEKSRKTALLILGYNRPEFVRNRLEECIFITKHDVQIICSIDGLSKDGGISQEESYFKVTQDFAIAEWIFEKTNLGLATHITQRISEVLVNFDNVIVIEDDVSVSRSGLISLKKALEKELPRNVLTIGLFGALPGNPWERVLRNRWRETIYFSAWGWAIQKEKWKFFSLTNVSDSEIGSLRNSSSWKSLSKSQRGRWERRFSKVRENPLATWDFQMQFLSFSRDLVNLLPIWRLCDNEGIGDPRATNTVHGVPNWYLGRKSKTINEVTAIILNPFVNSLFIIIDSLTWIGDKKIPRLRFKKRKIQANLANN